MEPLPAISQSLTKALDNLLGPSTHELGQYLGDKVRFLRWRAAISILERAKEIADQKELKVSPPPLKFIVPFIENASCDDPADELTELWANLLVSAASQFKPRHLLYSRLLNEISGNEVRYLDTLVNKHRGQSSLSPRLAEDAEFNFEMFNSPASPLRKLDFSMDLKDLISMAIQKLERPGLIFESLDILSKDGPPYEELKVTDWNECPLSDFDYFTCDILTSLNLVAVKSGRLHIDGLPWFFDARATVVTPLGANLFLTCSGLES